LALKNQWNVLVPRDKIFRECLAPARTSFKRICSSLSSYRAQRAEARLLEAQASGQSVSAVLSLQQWAKVLHSAPSSNPQRVLCGIFLPDGTDIPQYVHIMFVYESVLLQDDIDDSISLFYKVPIREIFA